MNINKTVTWVIIVVLLALGTGIYIYSSRPITPIAGADGTIKGNYSIESIRLLGNPYECAFIKSEGDSKIAGTVRITADQLRGDFDISLINSNFASHLIITGDTAYTWTSLQPIGNKGPIAKSTSQNASPIAQAQIIGEKDKIDYTCSIWNADTKVFEIPTGITFAELNN
ncbi:MAG: hypothetical protein AAB446_03165 [Patescibacteria group bacterium]